MYLKTYTILKLTLKNNESIKLKNLMVQTE